MSEIVILPQDDLPTVAFKVCTTLHNNEVRAVLTGGSAATVYAPQAYQSADADYILLSALRGSAWRDLLVQLGFQDLGREFKHRTNPIIVDFPDVDIRIGSETVERYDTITRENLLLHIFTPTDCVKDRLAHYFHWDDRSALEAAVAVAKLHRVDMADIRSWSIGEDALTKFETFERLVVL